MNGKPFKIDIACGKNKKSDFTGVDIWSGADIVADLEQFPWPFEDDSVDEIYCSHYIEHTPDLISFANELYRIMKVGAKAEIIGPYYSSIRAWQDPTHLRALSENTFLYFNREWRRANKLDHYPLVADFDFDCVYVLDPEWQGKNDDELRFAIKHYFNVVSDIRVVLVKRKHLADDVEALQRQAIEYWEQGMFEDAAKRCLELVTIGEADQETTLILADCFLKKDDPTSAAKYFRLAIDDEDSVQAHVGYMRSLSLLGRPADVAAHLNAIRINDPEMADLIEGTVSSWNSVLS